MYKTFVKFGNSSHAHQITKENIATKIARIPHIRHQFKTELGGRSIRTLTNKELNEILFVVLTTFKQLNFEIDSDYERFLKTKQIHNRFTNGFAKRLLSARL